MSINSVKISSGGNVALKAHPDHLTVLHRKLEE